jgi:selenocysteine-specific elongation factor
MLVATAGHIDHGKTALLRALTGADTDRLPEEKARGISIDLGFAYWRPDPGATIGFVDVPGHDRYIRNMLAGVGGVDCALLVVAADDGIMPQTIEHVAILNLLGIRRALVALTKADRVTPARLAEVGDQVAGLLAPTPLAGAAMFAVSSLTGAGVDQLAAALIAARDAGPARLVPGHHFRLAIDRAFSVPGAGTVVTGTVLAGTLEAGERLVIAPAGHDVRVRGLQSAARPVQRIGAGERGAINLAGVEVAQLHRGDWLVPPAMQAPTARIAAWLELAAARAAPLRHLAHVHLHHGTADIPARVSMPRGRSIAPGEAAMVQLWLDRPTLAVVGDRFVVRDQSGRQLLGGGMVVDPVVPANRRAMAARAPVAAAMRLGEPEATLRALLEIAGHEIEASAFAQAFNLTAAAAGQLFASNDAVPIGKARVLPAARVARVAEQLQGALAAFHLAHPEAGGMTPRELRERLTEAVSADALAAILRRLIDRHQVEQCGALLRLPGHAARFSAAEQAQWGQLEAWLDARGPRPFALADAMAELRLGEPATRALLYRRRLSGDLWQLPNQRFLTPAHVALLAAQAAALSEQAEAGFTAAQFRDVSGIGRNLVIEVLEFFDTIGVTSRRGNLRCVQPDYEAVVGRG